MQQSIFITILSLALAVSAMPAAADGGVKCSGGNEKQVCCNNEGLVSALSCRVTPLGSNCNGEVKCCNTEAAEGSLVNLQLLNCGA
ncbi:hypothetical protein GT037_003414 [Alternaria burnsii]|uniref:Hydrophobin n=1 Tax=Alternaria burnsii TaxID=1187904 RepID=A0A8H7BB73_9PLEO|nr:uncharacterized protein GT037_003414 [Alternaria burnsii]KAF7678033.1 hypothetical protein GT037_003414 [Alternaria burnsii]CAI9630512.1 unnamed protein product [Alternaria burnsii]